MDIMVVLVLFGMFALAITAIVVLGLYAKRDIAKFAINAVGHAFGQASRRVVPLKMEEGKQADSTGKSVDVNKVS